MADLTTQLTQALNPPQKEAVLHQDGPLLILAGAGSGKTRVLTHRMANLIASGVAATDEILCVTFTNKAAREMEHRIYKILADLNIPVYSQLWISTFHSFCVRILRQRIELLDYKSFFTIYDPGDQLGQIKKVMTALNINEKSFPAKSFQGRISGAKMSGLSPQDVEKSFGRPIMDPKSLEVYKRYEEEMKKANALDFDDLLLKTWDLFRMYPDVLEQYRQKFRYVMVDEYQDTNRIQYLLVQALTKGHRNLCVVGDEDQSIYSWRGADIRNILDFEKDYPETKIVKLEENYRSSGNIVQAATSVIRNNSQRKEKTLFTSNEAGDLIRLQEERNEYDEARFVAKTIEEKTNSGEGWNDFAVFYRTNAQSRVLEEQLRTNGIPYKIVGGMRFYERMEIKDILSYMRLSVNPADDMAFKRVINVPARGIGKTTLEKIEALGMDRKLTMFQAAEVAINERAFNAGTCGKVRRFLDLMLDLQTASAQFPIQEFYHIVLDRSEYMKVLKAEDSPESESRIENLEEFDNAIEQFAKERGDEASLQGFLEEMALVSDQDSLDEQVNSVTLMTLHISKGLEFPYVFIVGLEENLFPSSRSGGFDAESEDDLEEERRLAYVGMTRARRALYLTYARTRRVWGQEQSNPPSRFLKEIPQNLVDFKSAAQTTGFLSKFVSGAYGGASPRSGAGIDRNQSRDDFDDHHQFPDYDESSSAEGFRAGMKVRHPTFGVGSVYSTEGSGDQLRVSVLFADQTIKKFVVKYARLERLS